MKNILIIICVLLSFWSSAQIQITNETATTPNAKAALDVKSTTKALLLPRVERSAITNPSEGLIIYAPSEKIFYGWNGSSWINLAYGTTPVMPSNTVVKFSATTSSVSEGVASVTVLYTVDNPNNQPITVNLSYAGSATGGGTDYLGDQSIMIPANQTTYSQEILVENDSAVEGNETIQLTITSVTGGDNAQAGSPSVHTVTIQDDDVPPSNVFISEIGDPANYNASSDANNGRFIELYNPTSSAVNLAGYKIRNYDSNDDTNSNDVFLTGTIPAMGTYIIASASTGFAAAFPSVMPNQVDQTIRLNGDDSYELFDATSSVIDTYGVKGSEGTGSCQDFENGRAVRKVSIVTGNTTFNLSEWDISSTNTPTTSCTDHTTMGVNAPNGFSPGSR